ncbi:MAG: RecX family transcriptional regulator [Thermoflexales bacterium]|nr:RecX family transcriptional regulator [Thermoflexales bacterium]
MTLSLVVAAGLKVGQHLSDERIEALQAAEREEQARLRALGLLAYRPRSATEIRQRLSRAGIAAEDIERTLAGLERVGLVDDLAFAQAWAESRVRARPRSRRAIARELRQKGLADEAIQRALASVPSDEEIALRLAQSHLPKLRGLAPLERKRRISAFLLRKGFDYDTVTDVLARVEHALSAGTPSEGDVLG